MKIKYGIGKGVISMMAVGLLMVCTSTLMFVHSPLQALIKIILNLSDGSLFFNLWSAPPFDVLLKIYMFNITNMEAFLSGTEKMNVSELGPYVYREILTNENATFNDTDGTVTYSPHRTIVWDAKRTVGNPETDVITTTNLPLVGLQAYLSDDSFFKNALFNAATRSLGAEPLVNLTVQEYLWGYTDSLIRYAHMLLPSWIDFDKFGIFERLMNKDNNNKVTIVKDPSKYHSSTEGLLTEEERMSQYHVALWNDLAGITEWGFGTVEPEDLSKCHLVEGVFDGTVFPRNMPKNRTLLLYRTAFCRPVPLVYVQSIVDDNGFDVDEYKLSDNMFGVTPENQCYCYKNKCVKGFQSIAPCYYDMPVTLSQPHYFNADPEMLKTVNGLSPDPKLHGSNCLIQPALGIPVGGSMKIQLNLDVETIKGNYKLRVFNNMQIPLFWIEITTEELPFIVIVLIYLTCKVLPIALEVIKYILAVGGSLMISGSALYVLFRARVRIPGRISLNNTEYSAIPIISLPAEFLDKCEKRISLK